MPNSFLKIKEKQAKNNTKNTKKTTTTKNNVISLEKAKEKIQEAKKETEQLSIFGGVANEAG